MLENRKHMRYEDVARIEAPDICIFPGVLVDVSEQGCKVRFSVPVSVDMDNDYELKLYPTHKSSVCSFVLIGHPVWNKTTTTYSEMGFKILHSPGKKHFLEYISNLVAYENEIEEENISYSRLCLSI
ncbi:MAG: PilZ domain-containing protein [Treponema sp.]|nr:PilZ domain-containing protein [Treponema sp.]